MTKPKDWFFTVRQSNTKGKKNMKKYGFKGWYKGYQITRVFFANSYSEALATLAWTYPGSIKSFFEELPEADYGNVVSLNNKSTARKPSGDGSGNSTPQAWA